MHALISVSIVMSSMLILAIRARCSVAGVDMFAMWGGEGADFGHRFWKNRQDMALGTRWGKRADINLGK